MKFLLRTLEYIYYYEEVSFMKYRIYYKKREEQNLYIFGSVEMNMNDDFKYSLVLSTTPGLDLDQEFDFVKKFNQEIKL